MLLYILSLMQLFCYFYVDSNCTYNDATGIFYTGKRSKTDSNRQCVNWSLQKAYPAMHFPDKDIAEAGNYCRNPKPPEKKAWCYWKLAGGSQRRWGYCTLQDCSKCCSLSVRLTSDLILGDVTLMWPWSKRPSTDAKSSMSTAEVF